MSESLQAVLGLMLIIGVILSPLMYPLAGGSWAPFVGSVTLALTSFAGLLWSLLRRDRVPDFLRSVPGAMLERNGFCFKILANPIGEICYLDIHFQNRYERACHAMLAFQPSKGFFLKRPDLASFRVEIDCPPGGYGVTYVPWPVPEKYQGKAQSLDVGGDVFYPEGRGQLIRFRGGARVNTAGFTGWDAVLTVAGAMGGMIVFKKPAQVKVRLPSGVRETVDEDLTISTRIGWRLGDGSISAEKKKSKAEPEI